MCCKEQSNANRIPTLSRPAVYRIEVPGHLDESWQASVEDMMVAYGCKGDGEISTILTGTLDQAALQGLLRQLYAAGLPLTSVNLVD